MTDYIIQFQQSGYIVKLGSAVVCWRSKLQQLVTRSTTEAEYIAAGAAGMEICWVQNLLKELGYTPSAPAKLYMDNQSAMSVAKNPEHHGRMKHLDLCYYLLVARSGCDKENPTFISQNGGHASRFVNKAPCEATSGKTLS